jgi:hypothetical protein
MNIRRLAPAVLLAAALATGCASNTAASRDEAVRSNLTPELHTLSERPIDDNNRTVLTVDTNLRSANTDLAHLLLLDRPSRLTRDRMPR